MTVANPEWAELMQTAAAAAIFEVHTSMPGQIVAVRSDSSSKRQYVDVRPSLRRLLDTDLDAADPLIEEELPVLPNVPVAFMQGGGFFISVPLAVGDFVTVVFAERSIDRWLATARKASQVATSTGDVGTHTLDGAIALPVGPAPLGELLDGVSGSDLVIGRSGGIVLQMNASTINAGSPSASDFVALAALVKSQLQSLWDALNTHTHIVAGTLTPPTAVAGTAQLQPTPLGMAGDVASSVLKAD